MYHHTIVIPQNSATFLRQPAAHVQRSCLSGHCGHQERRHPKTHGLVGHSDFANWRISILKWVKWANYPWVKKEQITHGNSMGKLPMETQWANYPWVKCKMGKLPMETRWANYPEWVNQRTKWVASIAKSLRLIIAKITMKSPEKDLTSP